MRCPFRYTIAFLCIFKSPGYSQAIYNWYPLKPNTEYNYRFDTATTISNVLRIDSSKVLAGQTIHYLNKIVTFCDTCKNQNLENDPFDSTYVLNNQPQFLLHQFRFVSPDIFHFSGKGKSLTLKIHTSVGANWIYDSIANINATTLSKTQQTVFGVPDSVITIASMSGDTLTLSKNFGILRFSSYVVSKYKYSLEGLKGSTNYGVQQKFFPDFFNFNTGNVFQYEFLDEDYNIFPGLFKKGHEKWEMLSVSNFPDSVVCQIKKTYYDSTWLGSNPPTITSYTQNVKHVFLDSLMHFANFYPQQEVWADPYFPYQGSIKHIHKAETNKNGNGKIVKSFGETCPNINLSPGKNGAAKETAFPNVYLNRNNANTKRIVGREATEGLGITSELYNDYDRIIQRCLIGYIKGNDTSGVIYGMPVGITEIDIDKYFSAFPNPAQDQFILRTNAKETSTMTLLSIEGKILMEKTIDAEVKESKINCADLDPGIYFISIKGKNSGLLRKLVISR
jgi:hypothetical protein